MLELLCVLWIFRKSWTRFSTQIAIAMPGKGGKFIRSRPGLPGVSGRGLAGRPGRNLEGNMPLEIQELLSSATPCPRADRLELARARPTAKAAPDPGQNPEKPVPLSNFGQPPADRQLAPNAPRLTHHRFTSQRLNGSTNLHPNVPRLTNLLSNVSRLTNLSLSGSMNLLPNQSNQ